MTPSPMAESYARATTSGVDTSSHRGILLLAYYYPPQNTSGAARPARFAKYLPMFGCTPRIVSAGFDVQNTSSPPDVYPVPGGSIVFPARVHRNSRIAHYLERRLLPYQEELPWIPFAISQGAEIIRRDGVDAIFSTSPPIATHLAALALKRNSGVKWIADFRDPLLGNPMRNRMFARRYDMFLERLILRHADVVIANTDAVAILWQKRYPAWREKFRVLWNGFDPDTLLTPATLPPRAQKVISHVGTIYGGRDPSLLLRSVERVIARRQIDSNSILIKLVGPMDQQNLQRWAPASQCTSYLEVVPATIAETEGRAITATSDYLLLLDVNEHSAGLQVPAKLFEYIGIGRPILAITVRNSTTQLILSRSGVPFRCLHPDMSEDESDHVLLEFLRLPSTPVRANQWFWNTFNAAAQTAELASYLK